MSEKQQQTIVISDPDQEIVGETYTGSLSARMIHEDGKPYHTFRTQTVLVEGDRVNFRDCRFENTAGPGKEVGQAIALYIDADDVTLENCVISAHQDTLFLAPLPPKEIEPDGFIGPKQDTPRYPRIMHFVNCVIEGGVDFIFGGATATFDNCEFRSVEPGYVFAPSTPEGIPVGFLARNCKFTADPSVPEHSCYIARPWREYGKVRIEDCELGAHIHPNGWDDWGKTAAHDTVEFEEVRSKGPGAEGARPTWVKHIV